MPDLPDRSAREASIVEALRPIFRAQYDRALSNRFGISYGQFQSQLQQAMAAELADVSLAAANNVTFENHLLPEWPRQEGDVQRRTAAWAESFARELSSTVAEKSRTMADEALKLAGNDTKKQVESLALIFLADSRLQNIAITEATRATSAGEQIAVGLHHTAQEKAATAGALAWLLFDDERKRRHGETDAEGRRLVGTDGRPLSTATAGERMKAGEAGEITAGRVDANGERLVAVWWTEKDGEVCEHCRPLHGKSAAYWGTMAPGGPPLHPRCRCWIRWVRAVEWARMAA